MNVLSLFAGVGGLELGLERAGMTVVGQVEIDPYCRRVLAKHWPGVPRHDDVRTCTEWWRSEPRPRVDLVCGGFPCQDISTAGRGAGIVHGERSSLWSYMADTVRDLRPRYVLMENVAAILVRGLDVVAADLAEIGYDLEWDCIPAATVGAPHRRDRWFGVAYPQRSELRLEPITERRSSGEAIAGHDGTAQPLAYPAERTDVGRIPQSDQRAVAGRDETPHDSDASTVQRSPLIGREQNRDHAGTDTLADADEIGRRRRPRNIRPRRWPQPPHSSQWATEPDVGRMAHGIPHRVDRLRALGNAVVPQVAEHVGRLIMTAERAA